MAFFSLPVIAACLTLSVLLAVGLEALKTTMKYQHIPWVGTKYQSWWALLKCRFSNVLYLKDNHINISEEFWSQGRACFVPSALGDHIVIPASDYQWLLDQPDEVLNDTVNLNNELQAESTIGEPFMVHSPTIRETITRDLTRKLTTLTPDLFDEIKTAVDEEWGTDTQSWKELSAFGTFLKVIARSSNRIFVGLPLCRNPKLIYSALYYSSTLFPCSILIRHFPKPLRALVSSLITLSNQYHRRIVLNIIKPEVQRRLAELSCRDSEKAAASPAHNDFIQWLIDAALKSGKPIDQDPYMITQRMIILQFVTMYPITGTSTNALFDLISQPDSETLIADVRQEVNDVLAANGNTWTKRAASQLFKIDSALKESLRLAPVVAFGSGRRVMTKNGLTTPHSHTYLPEGSTVAVPSVAIHQDTNNYADAAQYKAFRFAEQREQTPADTTTTSNHNDSPAGSNTPSTARTPPVALTTTSTKFTSFGHGRLACPGRFFASDEMKLLFAYIIQNYDFETLKERPKRVWAGPFDIPPMMANIRVRRREKS